MGAGGHHSAGQLSSNSPAPRILDVGANTASGGALVLGRLIDRPQVNGTLSIVTSGWGGSHTLRIGGEYMSDRVVTPTYGFGNACPRLTVSLGLRLDRYQPSLPDQVGPASETFVAIDPVLTFNNWSPRDGVSADLTGDGKTAPRKS